MTPEAKACLNIDKMLAGAGYVLQDMSDFNRAAAIGVAVREYPTQSGLSVSHSIHTEVSTTRIIRTHPYHGCFEYRRPEQCLATVPMRVRASLLPLLL